MFNPVYGRLDEISNNFSVSALVSNGKLPLHSQWTKDKTDHSISFIAEVALSETEASKLTNWEQSRLFDGLGSQVVISCTVRKV